MELQTTSIIQIVGLIFNGLTLTVVAGIAYNAGKTQKTIQYLENDVRDLKTKVDNVRANVGTRLGDRSHDS